MIVWFSVVGLGLDLIGVVLLGIDLYKVQRAQRTSTERSKVALNEAFPSFYDLDSARTYLETGVTGGGEFDGDGYVDVAGLDHTLDSFRREIAKAAHGVTDVIEFLFSSAQEKADEAKRSLSYTRYGLALIVFGFILQLIGTIGSNLQLFGAFTDANL